MEHYQGGHTAPEKLTPLARRTERGGGIQPLTDVGTLNGVRRASHEHEAHSQLTPFQAPSAREGEIYDCKTWLHIGSSTARL